MAVTGSECFIQWGKVEEGRGGKVQYVTAAAAAAAKSLQSCPTLCDPMDYSLTGSSIHGIFHARVLEWSVIVDTVKR